MPLHRLGSMAEYVAVEPRQLGRAPKNLAPADAAALPVVGVTALIALRDVGGLQPGQRLLVRGASGGVGAVAVQLGRVFGAHVTGLASAANLPFVRELGADAAGDYAQVAPADLGSFDVVLDTVGVDVRSWRKVLAPRGRFVAIVPDPGRPLRSLAYFTLSRIHGSRRVRFFSAKPDTASLEALAGFVTDGTIRPVVDEVFDLARIADAHRAFEARARPGKQIVRMG